jgi:hypothetical protein
MATSEYTIHVREIGGPGIYFVKVNSMVKKVSILR